jgi:glycosidase
MQPAKCFPICLLLLLGCAAEDDTPPPTRAVAAEAALPSAETDIPAVKRWARERVVVAQQGDHHPSPASWADQVVYQIQVDRFNDGDPGNNRANISEWQRQHEDGDRRGLPDYVHGGDLAGIRQRLPYLQELGVTVLWLTPVLAGNGSYHGYCTTDFSRIDPSFGSAEELRDLTREAHRRGMYVVMDIVVNHICSSDTGYDAEATPFDPYHYEECVNDLNWKRWHGSSAERGKRQLRFGPSFFPPLRNQNFYSRCGFRGGDAYGHGAGAVFGDFSDAMLDFDTMNWDFQDIFTDLHRYWIAYADVDGFRLDAAKHVTEDFIAKFSTDVRSYAASLGKRDFFLVAEVAAEAREQALRVGNMRSDIVHPERSSDIPATLRQRLLELNGRNAYGTHPAHPRPGANAVYDFYHSGTAVDVLHTSRPPLAIKQRFYDGGETDHARMNDQYAELVANGDFRLNWTQLEIHDWPRFAQREFDPDGRRMHEKLRGALGYLLAAEGTPVLYYGIEQGLSGNCPGDDRIDLPGAARDEVRHVCGTHEHTRFRQDMFLGGPWRLGSVVGQIDALAGIGAAAGAAPSWNEDPYLARDHELYRFTRAMVHLRRSCAALRHGRTYFRAAHGANGGLLAFSRVDGHGGREMVVLVNTGDAPQRLETLHIDASLHQGRDFKTYRNLLNGYETASVGRLGTGWGLYFGGGAGLTLAPHEVAIFAHDGNVAGWDAGLGVHLCRN